MLKALRIQKNAEMARAHIEEMAKLEHHRDEFEASGKRAMVLAVNYELMSRASRAMAAIRKSEELARTTSVFRDPRIRKYVVDHLELPAIPRDAVEATPSTEIDRLYAEFKAKLPDMLTASDLAVR